MPFSSLGLSLDLQKATLEYGFSKPYPIQQAAIPAILEGEDILAIAETGSGKTASYVLPILMALQKPTDNPNRHIDVLVLVPTRELALQVVEVFQQFNSNQKVAVKSLAVYGGASINPQMIALQGVRIVVATPGRLIDLMESNALNLSSIQTLVLDEADKMLNLGFQEEMKTIIKELPNARQNLLFSATLSEDLETLKMLIMRNPKRIKIEGEEESIANIHQLAFAVSEERKGPFLRYLLKVGGVNQALIFCSSSKRADNVTGKLVQNGLNARAIHSKKSAFARRKALEEFKSGELPILVSTDLLARGIDIEFLPYVINYELPRSPKDYTHRIGRTGRAESPGDAISLVTPEEEHHFKVIQRKLGTWTRLEDTEDINLQGI